MDLSALVVQYGARRQYAVPAAFARRGMLAALYTDACATTGAGRVADLAAGALNIPAIDRLASRRPPPEVAERVRTFDRWALDMQVALRIRDEIGRVQALDAAHRRVARDIVRAGFAGATHLLTMYAEARGVISAAKERGLTTATDVYIAPSTEAILLREHAKHPAWEAHGIHWGETMLRQTGCDVLSEMIDKTDIFLCPSEFVRDDLVLNYGVEVGRTQLNPYTVNPLWFELNNVPEPGRILFAGAAGLRKGIHILSEATQILRGRGRKYQFYVVGEAPASVRARPETSELIFCGAVPFSSMRAHFEQADLLVLPSLAEGSAGVTYEALGAGVPIVTTRAAGSIVRDGIDGRIVAERDPEALADAIESIVEDRVVRTSMAVSARARAREFTWESFQERILTAVFS